MPSIEQQIDDFIQKQLDDYWETYPEHDPDDEDCECQECEWERKEADEEARADFMYDQMRENEND